MLVERGLFRSRASAQAAIMAGKVIVEGKNNPKAGDRILPDTKIEIIEPDCAYVSRGGLKLEGALDHFEIDSTGWNALDIGASTGGFTDCLLKRGALHVTALDVGRGLIDWSLRTDDRVTVIEKVNARNLEPDQAPGQFDLAVVDVSFISLKLIFPKIPERLKQDGVLLSLIKPQFEAGKGKAPKGVVKDPDTWREVLKSFISPGIFENEKPPGLRSFSISPITGKEGNVEFFGMWQMGVEGISKEEAAKQIENLITEVVTEPRP